MAGTCSRAAICDIGSAVGEGVSKSRLFVSVGTQLFYLCLSSHRHAAGGRRNSGRRTQLPRRVANHPDFELADDLIDHRHLIGFAHNDEEFGCAVKIELGLLHFGFGLIGRLQHFPGYLQRLFNVIQRFGYFLV